MRLHREILAYVACVAMALPGASGADTYAVNSVADPGDGTCNASECTLREAITASAVTNNPDDIAFAIAGAGPHIIDIATALPALLGNVRINGYTQPGSAQNTRSATLGALDADIRIVVRATAACSACNGFTIASRPVTIQGLSMGGFARTIVEPPASADDNPTFLQITGNMLGFMPDGVTPFAGNTAVQLDIAGATIIGGPSPGQRNLIRNVAQAISAKHALTIVEGNIIGLDNTGFGERGFGLVVDGRRISTQAPLIGGVQPDQRNWIAGTIALELLCSTGLPCLDGAEVFNNAINVDFAGHPLPRIENASSVVISARNGDHVRVGGTAPGQMNVIGMRGSVGVQLTNPSSSGAPGRVTVEGNAFIHAQLLPNVAPIWFSTSQPVRPVLPNDAGDVDEGVNRRINHPQDITTELVGGAPNTVTLHFRVDAAPSTATYPLRVDFYRITDDGGTGFSMTGQHVSMTIDSADAQQLRTFTLNGAGSDWLPALAMVVDADGNSSQFAPLRIGDELFADGFEDPL